MDPGGLSHQLEHGADWVGLAGRLRAGGWPSPAGVPTRQDDEPEERRCDDGRRRRHPPDG